LIEERNLVSDYKSPETRILPEITDESRAFWTGGERGELLIYKCLDCQGLIHPPAPACYHCQSINVAPRPVSGRATVAAKTINVHSFNPAMPSPFSVAIVELEEDSSTRLTTNVIGCPPESVHIGMKVQVEFEHYEDVWVPVFRPVAS
jgi:uncharacterized OB-fold protein